MSESQQQDQGREEKINEKRKKWNKRSSRLVYAASTHQIQCFSTKMSIANVAIFVIPNFVLFFLNSCYQFG